MLLERGARATSRSYRRRQIWEWAARGAAGYDEMTNVPAQLRERLAQDVPFSTLTVEHEAHAKDGTLKALFRTRGGHLVEAVLMRYRDGRRSVCVSSQSGCPLTCTFCATGQMQFGRNLTASEILDQALHFRRIEPIDHVVEGGEDAGPVARRELVDDRREVGRVELGEAACGTRSRTEAMLVSTGSTSSQSM